jgi:hypothetical protein
MALRIELYAPEHAESVKRLNSRLREGNVQTGYLISEEPKTEVGGSLDVLPDAPFTKRQFVVLEEDEVRGGFLLQEQQFEVASRRQWVGNIQMPISEGLVDRKYATVAGRMLKLLAEKRPFLFAVGMGSVEAQFARLLAAMNWRVVLVPFKFYIARSSKFFREIQPLHITKARAAAANTAAWTGLGYLGIRVLQASRSLKAGGNRRRLRAESVSEWGEWTEAIWNAYRNECSFIGIRDRPTLPSFHDLNWPGMIARRFQHADGRTRGWAAMQVTQMLSNKHFGNMRVGTLVDAICEPGHENALIRSAVGIMREAGADLIVCNHTHSKWLSALDASGFGNGPSNYVLAMSPKLAELIKQADPDFEKVHLTRGDGDGRIHL